MQVLVLAATGSHTGPEGRGGPPVVSEVLGKKGRLCQGCGELSESHRK